jgi:hypothetical protein
MARFQWPNVSLMTVSGRSTFRSNTKKVSTDFPDGGFMIELGTQTIWRQERSHEVAQ